MKKNDPVFPIREPRDSYDYLGLNKRDFIAIEAMKALISTNSYITDEEIVKDAYKMADAMIRYSEAK